MSNPNNRLPVNACALFMAKLTNEIDGEVTITFTYYDRLTLRYSHKGTDYRVAVDHADIVNAPQLAALNALQSAENE